MLDIDLHGTFQKVAIGGPDYESERLFGLRPPLRVATPPLFRKNRYFDFGSEVCHVTTHMKGNFMLNVNIYVLMRYKII